MTTLSRFLISKKMAPYIKLLKALNKTQNGNSNVPESLSFIYNYYRSLQSHSFLAPRPLSEKHSRTKLSETLPANGWTRILLQEDTDDRLEHPTSPRLPP
ncbi:unnamed protein product [Oikopleura dioica]|uniref:Uncharacterized protein n=1 Tax=Oikopleura dioica TaxID=34765 RepID=E4XCL7_OIKDI|nr:unnamed protein product [Oikopleura dioica]